MSFTIHKNEVSESGKTDGSPFDALVGGEPKSERQKRITLLEAAIDACLKEGNAEKVSELEHELNELKLLEMQESGKVRR